VSVSLMQRRVGSILAKAFDLDVHYAPTPCWRFDVYALDNDWQFFFLLKRRRGGDQKQSLPEEPTIYKITSGLQFPMFL
jgi:hypothetical protein